MKIGIDVSRANYEQKTGVEWYTFFLVEELKNIDTDAKFVLYADKPLQGKLAELPENWEEKVLHWPPKRLWTQVRLSWEMFFHPPDVLFIPAHVFPLIHPKKTVMTVHDVAAKRFPESYSWFERFYSLLSAKLGIKYLWKVIVPSKFTKVESRKVKVERDNIVVVPHGYDDKFKKIEDIKEIERVLKKYNIKKPFLLSVGRLEEKKNTRRIVQAFNEARSQKPEALSLVLVGKPGFGYEKVWQEIEKSPFRQNIFELGWVDSEDLPYLMNTAEVFVFPSLYEGFGMPVLEAFACGTSVVCSKGNSLEEVGGEAVIYVDSENVDSIFEGIRSLLENKDLKEEKIRFGLEWVKQFSWKKCAEETLEVLLSE